MHCFSTRIPNRKCDDTRSRLVFNFHVPKADLVPTERGRDEVGILKRDNGFADVLSQYRLSMTSENCS